MRSLTAAVTLPTTNTTCDVAQNINVLGSKRLKTALDAAGRSYGFDHAEPSLALVLSTTQISGRGAAPALVSMWTFSRCRVVDCIVLVDAGGPTLSGSCVSRDLHCGITQFDCEPAYLRPIGIGLLGACCGWRRAILATCRRDHILSRGGRLTTTREPSLARPRLALNRRHTPTSSKARQRVRRRSQSNIASIHGAIAIRIDSLFQQSPTSRHGCDGR